MLLEWVGLMAHSRRLFHRRLRACKATARGTYRQKLETAQGASRRRPIEPEFIIREMKELPKPGMLCAYQIEQVAAFAVLLVGLALPVSAQADDFDGASLGWIRHDRWENGGAGPLANALRQRTGVEWSAQVIAQTRAKHATVKWGGYVLSA